MTRPTLLNISSLPSILLAPLRPTPFLLLFCFYLPASSICRLFWVAPVPLLSPLLVEFPINKRYTNGCLMLTGFLASSWLNTHPTPSPNNSLEECYFPCFWKEALFLFSKRRPYSSCELPTYLIPLLLLGNLRELHERLVDGTLQSPHSERAT